ncbi:hypothetical protein AB9P05_19120 [Roseivirga sp. BDSF3-8]|uniref:hypothetical protein n=1 Tax=Roseivirga sp. BDSF3-8 TaxID=3241598 RepID=UPI00353257E2
MMSNFWKKTVVGFLMIGGLFSGQVFAQDDEVPTDEELKAYIVVMDSIEDMKISIGERVNEMIQSSELMQGGRRYKELDATKGDSVKLVEISATEEEIAEYDAIIAYTDSLTILFKENYTTLIKDDLGAGTYNKVRKAERDPEVKERMKAIREEMKEEEESEEEEAEEEVEG